MDRKPLWIEGAINDLFDGKESTRDTNLFVDMLDGGGYGAAGENGGILGFMKSMFGGGQKAPGAPMNRPKMEIEAKIEQKRIPTQYMDAMGMGTQPGGQTTYYDGMGMDYGMGRPDQGSGMTPANAYVPQQQQYAPSGMNPANAYVPQQPASPRNVYEEMLKQMQRFR